MATSFISFSLSSSASSTLMTLAKAAHPHLQSFSLPLLCSTLQDSVRTSLVVQGLRLLAPNAGGLGLSPGQGTRSHVTQLRVCMLQLKIWHVSTKTQCSQIKKKKKGFVIKCDLTYVFTHLWSLPHKNVSSTRAGMGSALLTVDFPVLRIKPGIS